LAKTKVAACQAGSSLLGKNYSSFLPSKHKPTWQALQRMLAKQAAIVAACQARSYFPFPFFFFI
jgi:hypothetical protein